MRYGFGVEVVVLITFFLSGVPMLSDCWPALDPPLELDGPMLSTVTLLYSWLFLYRECLLSVVVPGKCLKCFLVILVFLYLLSQMRWQELDFLRHWPVMLLYGLLLWRSKLLTYWRVWWRILLYLQFVLILCFMCTLYSRGSVQLLGLCNILVTRGVTMCIFFWFFHGLWTWYLVVRKVLCVTKFAFQHFMGQDSGVSLWHMEHF